MYKNRLIISVVGFFLSGLFLMLGSIIQVQSFLYLHLILSAVFLLGTIAFLVLPLFINANAHEKYAPKLLAQTALTSIVGIVILIALAVLLNKQRFSTSVDVTKNQVNSLSVETIKVLSGLSEQQGKILVYCVPDANGYNNFCKTHAKILDLYVRNSDKLENVNLSLFDPKQINELKISEYSSFLFRLMDKEGKELNRQVVSNPDESAITNAIVALTKSKKVIYFMIGYGEPQLNDGPKSYSSLVETLKAKGYEAKEHDATKGDLPTDAQVVFAGSNTQSYDIRAENVLRKFLSKGGKLILSINPHRDLGLNKLLSDIGVEYDNKLLIGNVEIPELAQLYSVNPARPPVYLSKFNKDSEISSIISKEMPFALSDGARGLKVTVKDGDIKIKPTELVSAIGAAPVSLSENNLNQIDLDIQKPLNLSPDVNFDPNIEYKVAYEISIDNADKLSPTNLDVKNEVPTPAVGTVTPKPNNNVPQNAQVVIFGFTFAQDYGRFSIPKIYFPLISATSLYKDKDLLSIPAKDRSIKGFKMENNPGKYLPLFAFLPVIITLLTGIYIWIRRRQA